MTWVTIPARAPVFTAQRVEDNLEQEHLTREQILRYVNRLGDVDEILDIAQHLDDCDDCRDRAAVIAADQER